MASAEGGDQRRVADAVQDQAQLLVGVQRLGAPMGIEEIELPDYDLFEACGRVILVAEAYAVHEQDLKTRPLAYGRYTYQRIAPGAVLSAADRLRAELTEVLHGTILAKHDAIVTATGLEPARRFDAFGRDVAPWKGMLTIPFNVTGSPALAVPIGFSASGLPLGMQIVGRPFDEAMLFRIGAAYEAATRWFESRPELDLKMAG